MKERGEKARRWRHRVPSGPLALGGAAGIVLVLGTAGTTGAQEAAAAGVSTEAKEGTFAAARSVVLERTAERLEALAAWCQERRLYAERDRLYERLIGLAPEHAQARRHLKYRKTREGWKRERYRAPKNYGSEELGEVARRLTQLEQEYREDLLALFERFDGEVGCEGGQRILDDLLVVVPDDPEARERRGEVRLGPSGDWVLRETAVGRGRRALLASRAREIVAGEIAVESCAPAGEEATLAWKAALAADHLRLLATCDEREAAGILRRSEGAARVFALVFDEEPSLPRDYTVYVLACRGTKRRFLQAHPRVDAAVRAQSGRLDSVWIPSTSALAVWSTSEEMRADQVVRQTVQRMLADTYGIGSDHAWAYEGFGLYLCELVTGSGDAVRNASSRQDAERWKKGLDLWEEARGLVASGERPDLRALLTRGLDELSRAEVLLSYALARYLIEGNGDGVPRLLDDVGRSGRSAAHCLELSLGVEPELLEERLIRWILETSAIADVDQPARVAG